MNCQEFVQALERYVEGEGEQPDSAHSLECASCRDEAEVLTALVSDLETHYVQATFQPAQVAAVMGALEPAPISPWQRWGGVAVAAVAASLLTAVLLQVQSQPTPDQVPSATPSQIAVVDVSPYVVSPYVGEPSQVPPAGVALTAEVDLPTTAARLTPPGDDQVGNPATLTVGDWAPLERPARSVNGRIDDHLALNTDAKVHFQTDKPLYRPGETMWFKAWIVDAETHQERTAPFQVELVAPNGSVTAQTYVASSLTDHHACFDLPAELVGGEYQLRLVGQEGFERTRRVLISTYQAPAYKKSLEFLRKSYAAGDRVEALFEVTRDTGDPISAEAQLTATAKVDGEEVFRQTARADTEGKLLLAFDLPAQFERGEGTLTVRIEEGGFAESKTETIPILHTSIDFALYPEGGPLVTGQRNRVYFQGKDPKGEPANVEGELLADGQVIATLASAGRGFGRFEVTPEAGKAYHVRITKPAGIERLFELPAPEAAAANLLLEESSEDYLVLSVNTNRTRNNIYVVGMSRGVRLFTYRGDLEPGANRLVVPVTRKLRGITRVTLLDSERIALAERLLFRAQGRELHVRVSANQDGFVPREQVELTVETTDETGEPIPATVALSVVNDAVLSYADDKSASLATRLYLESEVRGKVFEPNYYLSGEEGAEATLDYLLNTQGYRRFEWSPVFEQDPDFLARAREAAAEGDSELLARIVERGRLYHPRFEAELTALSSVTGLWQGAWAYTIGPAEVFAAGKLLANLETGTPVQYLQLGRTPDAIWARVRFRQAETWEDGWTLATRLDGGDQAAAQLELAAAGGFERELEHDRFAGEAKDDARNDELLVVTRTGVALPPANLDLKLKAELGRKERLLQRRDRAEFGLVAGEMQREAGRGGWASRAKARYLAIQRRVFPQVDHSADPRPEVRTDFRETVYWNPSVRTDAKGKATVSFYLSDAVTSFAATAEGISTTGAAASGALELQSKLPFTILTKVPNEVTAGDVIQLPVLLRNDTNQPLPVELSASFGSLLTLQGTSHHTVRLAAGESRTVTFRLQVEAGTDPQSVEVVAQAAGLRDAFQTTVQITDRGFPVSGSTSGVIGPRQDETIAFELPENVLPGTLQAELRLHPSPLSTMLEGLEGMLREPGGCFEQTTSSNFPNTLVTQYLSTNDVEAPAVFARARQLLDRGYGMLTGFECQERGFEWFGQGKGHEALTAMGLMQFKAMQQVGTDVSQDLLDRTAEWLKGRVNAEHGYDQNPRFLHTWAVDHELTDCYITFALTEAGYGDLDAQLKHCVGVARDREDPYVLALVAGSLLKDGSKPEVARELLARLAQLQRKDGSFVGTTASVVASRGLNLEVETTGLALVALLRSGEYRPEIEQAVEWLNSKRNSGGSYGTTQATVLALRALVDYANASRRPRFGGDLVVIVNGDFTTSLHFAADHQGSLVLPDLAQHLRPGLNTLEVTLDAPGELPFTLAVDFRAVSPSSAVDNPVRLTTTLDKTTVRQGEVVDLRVKVENTSETGIPMSLARIGYPGGLNFRLEQLKELRDAGEFAFFETTGKEIVLYFTGLEKGESREFSLDLTAMVPGDYTGEASSAYLYYGNDQKQWLAPLKVEIQPASGQ